jgi:hypothetical protein
MHRSTLLVGLVLFAAMLASVVALETRRARTQRVELSQVQLPMALAHLSRALLLYFESGADVMPPSIASLCENNRSPLSRRTPLTCRST